MSSWMTHPGPGLGSCDDQNVGHPPFGAQVILNGHEYVAAQAAGHATLTAVLALATAPGGSPHRQTRPIPPLPPAAARTITALLTLRDQVITPILAGVRSPRMGRNPRPGPPSTATTNRSASTCTPSSTTSASPPRNQPKQPHRQQIVDQNALSA